MKFKWNGETLEVSATPYMHKSVKGQIALDVHDEDGCPYCIATVAIPATLPSGAVIIKNYSENKGIDAALISGGIIEPFPVGYVSSGYVRAPVYMLTEAAMKTLL